MLVVAWALGLMIVSDEPNEHKALMVAGIDLKAASCEGG